MPRPGYSFRPQAQKDAIEIALYIAKDSLTAAEEFLDLLETTCARIAEIPGMGSRRMYKNPALRNVRMAPVSKFDAYLIFYRGDKGDIDVIRVVQGARDLPTLFGE